MTPCTLRRLALATLAASLVSAPLAAQQADLSAFETGPVFEDFGPHAPVPGADVSPLDRYQIAFDVAAPKGEAARNRGFESAARFINMHVAAGVREDWIDIAVVVHGRAVMDLVAGKGDANEAMVRAMLARGVRFIVCGQTAAAYGVTDADLIEGVEMDLSAMTAHALLQQAGYTVNPF